MEMFFYGILVAFLLILIFFTFYIIIAAIMVNNSMSKASDDYLILLMKEEYGNSFYLKLDSDNETDKFAQKYYRKLNMYKFILSIRITMIIEKLLAEKEDEQKDDSKDIFGI